jgi:uncharacterized Tic20 family protein
MEQQPVEIIVHAPGKDARNWAMICHLAALSGYLIPFGNILGPLIIWVLKKDDDPFINDQGKEVLNFQLTMTMVFLFCAILIFILIGFLLVAALGIAVLILTIVGAINANEGRYYRYPMTIRFFK